jgi:hypothetical protein
MLIASTCILGLLHQLLRDRAKAERLEDQIDHHLPVPRLDQPVLRRALGAHAPPLQRSYRALGVLAREHQIQVVVRPRTGSRPAGQAAAQHERHLRLAQRRGRPAQRGGDRLMGGLPRVHVLEGESTTLQLAGHSLGIAGAKGFIAGFAGSSLLADFGEPALRQLHRITSHEVAALDRALAEIELCQIRIALLHYSPTIDTLAGEHSVFELQARPRTAATIR